MKIDKIISQIKYADAAAKDEKLSPTPETKKAWTTISDCYRTILSINYGSVLETLKAKR